MTQRVGYIGAGVMGAGIIKNLRKHGFPVSFIVHSNRARVSELTDAGAVEVADYQALAAASDILMLTVPDSSVVEPLLLGESGIGPYLRSGQIVIDLSTSYPASTRKIAEELGQRGITVLDAPLTGSRTHAESGKLNVMCGGSAEAFEQVRPLFDAIAANVFHVGVVGVGHTIKLINNYLGQVTVAAVCEILPFAQKSGVSLQALYDVVSVSGGNSNQFQGLVPRVMKRDFGINFQLKYIHKDIRYITMAARESRIPTPVANALLGVHDMSLAKGYGDEDFSGLLKFWEEVSGVKVEEKG